MSTPSSLTASSLAFRRMRDILFRPFNLNRWFSIGFCAWLAQLGSGGGGGNSSSGHIRSGEFQSGLSDFLGWLCTPLGIGVVGGLLIVVLALGTLFCWLRSRGDFMLLYRVYQPDETVGECWRRSKAPGESFFFWRVGLFVVSCLVWVLFGIVAYRTLFAELITKGFHWDFTFLPVVVLLVTAFILIALTIETVFILAWDFAVPVMHCRGVSATTAWRTVFALCNQHPFAVTGYLLLMSVWWLVTFLAVVAFALGTCCLGFIALIIPYIGTVVLLPIYVFFRAYPIYFLNQWQPGLFPAPGEDTPMPPPSQEPTLELPPSYVP